MVGVAGVGARLIRVTPEAIVGRLVLRTTRAHDRDMKSRVHPKYKTKYHVQNWASYERALVRRGNVTVWLSPEAIAAWEPDGGGTRGGQRKYSDVAIETALTLRLIFHLPLRQADGFLISMFGLMGVDLPSPDHTTLSRRGQHLDVTLRRPPRGDGLHLIIDSTGLSMFGEGEWAAAKHGGHGKRGWKKLHLGVDRSGVIVAQALTDATVDDAVTGTDLIGAVEGDVASVTADAAYDTIAFYNSARQRGAKVVVPPVKTAGCPDADRGRALAIARSGRSRSWAGADGRRRQVIIARPAWSIPSSGTNRFSAIVCEPELQVGKWSSRSSRATC